MSKLLIFDTMTSGSTVKEDLIQEQILQAAKQLFSTFGLAKVTMEDVAKAIGKGRSSLYYYFRNKEELFDAVVANEIGEMIGHMERSVKAATTAADKIRAFCMAQMEVLRDKKSFFSSMETGMDADALSQFNKVRIMQHQQINQQRSVILDQIITQGIKHGEFRSISPKERKQLNFVLLACLHGLKREMRLQNNLENFAPVVETFYNLIMQGLRK